MCRITFLTHACGHYSSPTPTQCAIYRNYYSSDSVLELASTLIASAHECPFVQCHAHASSAKCAKCTGGRFNLPLDTACGGGGRGGEVGNPSNTPSPPSSSSCSCSSSSSSSSTWSNEKTLALLESAPLRTEKPLPPTPSRMMAKKVMGWVGWAKMNKWRTKIMRGGFGGEKVRRKIIRSSITDLHSHSSAGHLGYLRSEEWVQDGRRI